MSRAQDSLLRVLMSENSAIWRVAGIVTPDDFTPWGRRVYLEILEGAKAGRKVDGITLDDSEAMDIWCNAPGVLANIESYANDLARAGEKRRVREAGKRISAADCFADAQAILAEVRPGQAQRVKSAKDGLAEMLETMQLRSSGPYGLSWGIPGVDAVAGRLVGSRLYGVAGRAKMGKTTLALQPQIKAILEGRRVLTFSLEMTAGELTQRALASIGQFSHEIFEREEGVPDEAWSFIHAAAAQINDAPWLLDDQPGLTPEQIASRTRQHHMESELAMVVVDHIGLVALPKRSTRNDELGELTYGLKNLAKELNIPVMALCQLNRSLETRTDKRPIMSDLRDSGNIEQDMDSIIAIYRDEVYHEGSEDAGHAEIISLANRHGRGGTAFVLADMERMTYGAAKHPRKCFPAATGSARGNSGGGGFSNYGQARSQPRAVPGYRGDM